MDVKILKYLRVFIPGVICVFELLPLLKTLGFNLIINSEWLSYSFLGIIAVVIGAIYHALEVRHFITNFSHRRIDLNITNSLLKLYSKELSQEQHNYLKAKRRLKNIFYYFVDIDKSLTVKSQLVYFNGVFWTSTADVFIISTFYSVVYLIAGYFVLKDVNTWMFGILLAGVALLGVLLHIVFVSRHINLSNDQLEYIETHYKTQLTSKIDEVLQQLS